MAVWYRQINGRRTIIVPPANLTRPYFALLCQLCEAQNWRCCYCGIEMKIGREGEWSEARWKHGRDNLATLEHVVPRVAGGSNDWGNLTAACRLCNNGRGAMRAERYLRFVIWKGREKAARYTNRLRGKIMRRQNAGSFGKSVENADAR